jgi:predicted HicB family RNase H-like nuclease
MPGVMKRAVQRPRISLDVTPAVRRRVRLAAAKRDVSVRQYIMDALQERLRDDLGIMDRKCWH